MDFNRFNLHPRVMSGVVSAGFTTPTPIQASAIPAVLSGRDVLGIAQTGTGKTAAFSLPTLSRLMDGPKRHIRALVVAPTRELAEQIHQHIELLGRNTPFRSATVYGGVGYQPQVTKLRTANIVVACPGRMLDHLARGTVDLSHVETLVLDEADRMFDMGFMPNIRKLLTYLPAKRQNLLFSATMPEEVRHLVREVLKDHETVKVDEEVMATSVAHALYPVKLEQKLPVLLKLLGETGEGSVLVFTKTKHRATKIAEKLAREGHSAASLQGNLSQNRRQAALDGFRKGSIRVLVATDIAARGIDVATVSHVINFDMPNTVEDYAHRTGRTGRACRSGDAFSLVTREDEPLIRAIERLRAEKIERRYLSTPELADATSSEPYELERTDSRERRAPSPSGRNGWRKPSNNSSARRGKPSRSNSRPGARAA